MKLIPYSVRKKIERFISSLFNLGNEILKQGSHLLRLPAGIRMKLFSPENGRVVVRVPLRSIHYFLPNERLQEVFYPNRVHFSHIPSYFWSGDWDRNPLSIENEYSQYSVSYRSVRQIFLDGREFRNCDEYLEKVEEINKTGRSARGNSMEELDQYFHRLLNLEKSIRRDGYLTQEELGGDPIDEVGVFIDREGNLIKAEDKFCGTHRFAIAKYVGVETLPVCILAVHEQWAHRHPHLLSGRKRQLETHFSDHKSSQKSQ